MIVKFIPGVPFSAYVPGPNIDPDNGPGVWAKDDIVMSDGSTWPNNDESAQKHADAKADGFRSAKEAEQKRHALLTGKKCPFSFDAGTGHAQECRRDCAMYYGGKCYHEGPDTIPETDGKPCPLLKKCTRVCALSRDGGCSLTH